MQNRNPTIAQDMNRLFDFKGESTDFVSDIIMPVVEIKRICNILKFNSAVNATTATIYTTPSDKDFYLVAAQLSVIKDATSTSGGTSIFVIIEGVSVRLLSIATLTLTAQYSNIANNFPVPIKIDRNTIITVVNSTNNANISGYGSIQGYTVETTKGV